MYQTSPSHSFGHSFATIIIRNTVLSMFFLFSLPVLTWGQMDIAWQKTFGTPFGDIALKVFPDESGNMMVIGQETHADFAGNIRPYLMLAKIDHAGNEIWKTYHDVAFNTFNPPVDYTVGRHFYTEEFGDTLLNLVISIQERVIQYKVNTRNGDYYFYEEISSNIIDITRANEKVYANVLCSIQQSCYGPDSLVVQLWDPTPDSIIFNPIIWTFGLKQNFRTAPIQGHYDFDIQDIRMDGEGNTYLLVQIERWNFQFCTDCPDAFADAWNEVFKFDSEGNLLTHVNLRTTTAVVSNMSFVRMMPGMITLQISDINASGTKVITSIYRLDENLEILQAFDLDEAYTLIIEDAELNLFTSRNVFDKNDPQIKGLSDVLVSGFDADGELLWDEYFGGTNWDFPRALTFGEDGSLYFLANSESSDFDVHENFGGQDIWLVKLTEEGATSVEDIIMAGSLNVYPNPFLNSIHVVTEEPLNIGLYDMHGRIMQQTFISTSANVIDGSLLPQGCYVLKGLNANNEVFTTRVVKL